MNKWIALSLLGLAACGPLDQMETVEAVQADRPSVHAHATLGAQPVGESLTTGVNSGNGIYYRGGSVMHGVTNVYYIWYGNWSGNSATSILTDLASNIGGSKWYAINTTYGDSSGAVYAGVKYAGSTTDSYSQGTSLSDASIQTIVSSALSSGRLPVDSNGVYFVLTSADVDESSGFCTRYCGWHTYATLSGTTIKYSFVGDSARCNGTCWTQSNGPNGNGGADAMASVIAHELVESVSDPTLNVWTDSTGYENADKCAWTFGSTYTASNGTKANLKLGSRDFYIQQNWVNDGGGYCAMGYDILSMARYTTQSGDWLDGMKWMSGDFNGDGKLDVANVWGDTGLANIDVRLSTGSAFSTQSRWANQSGAFADNQQWLAGDFNGDGKSDLVKVYSDTGANNGYIVIEVYLSTGTGFASPTLWLKNAALWYDMMQWVVGDFNGDGKDDLGNVWGENGLGNIDVRLSNGSSFNSQQRWANQQGGWWSTQRWVAGDFNGDGKADMAKAFSNGGYTSIDVHASSGSGFSIQRFATNTDTWSDSMKFVVGDFDGDGKADIGRVYGDNGSGTIDVFRSTGSVMYMQRWATQQGGYWDNQRWIAGDFNGDGKDDLAKSFSDSSKISLDVHKP